jgi:glycosyltransferase involved in cell wall biosynthesis
MKWMCVDYIQGVRGPLSTIKRIIRLICLIYTIYKLRNTSLRTPQQIDPGEPLEIVMLVISEVWRDPRVEREARALAKTGFLVKILYPDYFSKAHNIAKINWDKNITFRPLSGDYLHFMHKLPYVYEERFIQEALFEKPFAFHAHDLSTCLIGLVAAHKTGANLVCDFHEWYSENVTYNSRNKKYKRHPFYKRYIYRVIEKIMLEKATTIITVCDSIANELKKMTTTSREILVVRNIPLYKCNVMKESVKTKSAEVRKRHNISEEKVVILYQGGVGPSRLLEPIIEAMKWVNNGVLLIRGPGIEVYQNHYMKQAIKGGVAGKLLFELPVPSALVVEAAIEADVGIWTLPNLSKNFYYSLPNKVFEYLAAGLPILCAHYPEVSRIIDTYQVGLTFDPYDPASIAESMNKVCNDFKLREILTKNIPNALKDLQADQEWDKIVNLYQELADGIAQ